MHEAQIGEGKNRNLNGRVETNDRNDANFFVNIWPFRILFISEGLLKQIIGTNMIGLKNSC